MSKVSTWRLVAVTYKGIAYTLSDTLTGTAQEITALAQAAYDNRAADIRHVEWDVKHTEWNMRGVIGN